MISSPPASWEYVSGRPQRVCARPALGCAARRGCRTLGCRTCADWARPDSLHRRSQCASERPTTRRTCTRSTKCTSSPSLRRTRRGSAPDLWWARGTVRARAPMMAPMMAPIVRPRLSASVGVGVGVVGVAGVAGAAGVVGVGVRSAGRVMCRRRRGSFLDRCCCCCRRYRYHSRYRLGVVAAPENDSTKPRTALARRVAITRRPSIARPFSLPCPGT